MPGLNDFFHRPINYLRISITDRCNLRCVYCMPAEGIQTIPHNEILSYEEIFRIVQAGAELGINKIRLTGGEPLVRDGLADLVRMIAGIAGIDDIALTTNGVLLGKHAVRLKDAGLKRINVSLDSLQPEKFIKITRGTATLDEVLHGIEIARNVGLDPIKINMVVMNGINDDEVIDFARKTITDSWNVRYIELMPFTGPGITDPRFMSFHNIKKKLDPLGKMIPHKIAVGNGPAKYYCFPQAKGSVGFITPVTEHFCFNCNRLRLTSDGKLRPCLLSDDEIDLKEPIRAFASFEEIKNLIKKAVVSKPLQHHLAECAPSEHQRPMRQVGG